MSTQAAVVDQFEEYGTELFCYYVMGLNNVSCPETTSSSPGTIDNTDANPIDTVSNPSFMTSCVGYSFADQPNSYYIDENDVCIVDGSSGDESIAAIATCCALREQTTTKTDSSLTTTQIILIVTVPAVVLLVIGIVALGSYLIRRSQEAVKKQGNALYII